MYGSQGLGLDYLSISDPCRNGMGFAKGTKKNLKKGLFVKVVRF